MRGTTRALLLLLSALAAPTGCIVGPQEDLPVDPQADLNGAGDRDGFADGDADGDEGGAPGPEAGAFDGEDPYWAGEGEPPTDPNDDADSASPRNGVVEIPVPAWPLPGPPPLAPALPDLSAERSDDAVPPGIDAADAPGDDFVEQPSDD